MSGFLAGLCVAILPLLAAGFWLGRRTARPENLGGLGTPVEHATFETLHTASLAAPPLRAGLTEETARKSARRLRTLLARTPCAWPTRSGSSSGTASAAITATRS